MSTIKQKEKKCKGTDKAIGYGCGSIQLKRRYGLGYFCGCFNNFLLNSDAGQEVLSKSRLKAKKDVETHIKKENTKAKRELIDYKGKLQSEVQKIARLIDLGQPCLATNRMVESYDGGHVHSKGSHTEMKFNIHNIHAQSSKSNHGQKDDILMSEGLKRVYGQEYQEFVQRLKNKPITKLFNSEYHQAHKVAVKWSKKLEKAGDRYDTQQRVKLRNQINIELEIYQVELCVFNQN